MDLEPPLLRGLDGAPLLSRPERTAAVERLASALSTHGVREGDVVATVLPAGPSLAAAAAACWRLGAVLAPLGDQLPPAELDRALAAARPRGLLAPAGAEVEWRPCSPAASDSRPGDALLLLTSGSTGTPKAVILTRANVAAGTAAVVGTFGLGEADATLALLPLTHGHGLLGVLLATAASGGSVLLGARGNPRAAVEAIVAGRVSWISVVPPLLALLVEAARSRPVRGRLRFIRTASAPLPVGLASRAEEVFDCPVAEAYGMTETSHQAAANPPDRERRRLGTVGVPTGTEWRLAGEEVGGGRLLEVRGPGVFRGYLGQPELTDAALTPDGWYRTLDVGRVEAGGHLRLLGRRSEFINRGGAKVAPAEVEEAASSHPDVAACLAAAVPHPVLGEEVGLLVVPRQGGRLDVADLRRHCAERLADDKRPGVIGLADRLPGLASGKPSRSLAGQLLAAGR
ncbi:MAG TPA: AMP-binding protein [Candidatus Dormibacteraeota bacterium]|nr:AMP-binding protein [Candidatus Dormibacteraeota bacterium]